MIACYNTGEISGHSAESYDPHNGVGGVVGAFWPGNVTACYNIGDITILGGTDEYVGSVIGYNTGGVTAANANYWKSGTADKGIGKGPGTATPFSASPGAWPSASSMDPGYHAEWGIGSGTGSGTYWKSLGGWNSGSPVYPKLWYEE
jgi:hypothetical protein